MTRERIVLAITGASGAIYALRLFNVLLAAGRDVYLTVSPSGAVVFAQELGIQLDLTSFVPEIALDESCLYETNVMVRRLLEPAGQPAEMHQVVAPRLHRGRAYYCHYEDLLAPIASGSFLTAGMVVCPCSGSTLGAIARAIGTNLIHRAAEVHLKERRKLILVPRETPLSFPQLDNMRRATEAGAVVLPASPGYYHGVTAVVDLVNFVVARICDQLGVRNDLISRWGTSTSSIATAPDQ